jgi:signal transduction histidine kinase/ligand-binding sensor domain-containing protein
MTGLVRLILAMLALCAVPGAAASDSRAGLGRYTHSSWTGREGVPGMVQALAQSADGYLWVGTYEGLYRFDGVSFEYVAPAPGHPAGSIPVSSILVTRGGDLWVGYAGGAGVEVRRGGRMLRGGMVNPPSDVTELREDRDGGIWAVGGRTRRALKRYWHGSWQAIDSRWGVSDQEIISSMLVARDGTVWLATDRRLQFLRRGGTRFEVTPFAVANGASMAEDRSGGIWLSDPRGTRMVPDYPHGATAPRIRISYPPMKGPIRRTSILFDRSGNLWGSSYTGGIFRIAAPGAGPVAAVDAYRIDNGLTSNQAVAILEDREGNIWVGTELGLDQFRPANIVRAELPQQSSAYGYNMAADDRGDVYISSGTVLYRAGPHAEPRQVLAGPEGQALCRGAGGVLWYVVKHRLLRLEDGRVTSSLPLAGDEDVSGCTEIAGRLWLALQTGGLLVRKGAQWRTVRFSSTDPRARDLVTSWGDLLVATHARSSVMVLRGDRVTRLTNAQLGVAGLTTIYGTPTGLLVGGGIGLVRYDGHRFQRLSTADHPWLRGIRGIVQTARGETWMLNNRGMVRLRTADLDRAFAAPRRTIPHDLFDEQDGLSSRAQNTDGPQVVAGADNRVWLLTRQGPLRIDPASLWRNAAPPPVAIRALTADGVRYADPTHIELRAGLRNLSIDYTGLSMTVPTRVRFRYKLEGVDPDWVDPGTRRQAFYTNLAPGNYRFRVVAANNDGVWNRQGATLEFTIPPTFVQSRGFAVLCLLAALGLLWLLYDLRLRAVARRMRARMAERLAERERIARELHDTLLQGVQALILRFQLAAEEVAPGSPSRRVLEEALDRADDVIAEGRDRVRDLRMTENGENLERMILDIVHRQVFPASTRVHIEADGEPRPLAPLVSDEIARIANEALFNMWRHAEASRIDIDIVFRTFAFTIRFRDNGVGIAPDILQAGHRAGHFGLTGMRERARKLQAELIIRSAAGHGTELSLVVPAAIAYTKRSRRRRIKIPVGGESG